MTHQLVLNPNCARTLFLVISASAFTLTGCSKSDNAKDAVSAAELEFRKVALGDSTSSDGFAHAAYTAVVETTSQYAGNDADFSEAAAVSLAISKLGLATLAGGEAAKTETVAIQSSRVIRSHLSEWIAMNAVALASSNFDSSDEKKQLQDLIKLRSSDVEKYSELLALLKTEIENYQSQIDELNSKSITERNEGARFELQMTSVSATQAAQLALRVREHSLRADSFEFESDRLQGRLGQLLPGAHEVELQVKKANDQINLLDLSIDELDQRVRDSKQDSALARANAMQAQTKLTELVEALESYRSNTVIPTSQKVVTLIRQSLSASRDASNVVKTSGAIAKASANEHLGRALSRQARGEMEMVSLYQSIISAGVPGNWQSKLDSHTSNRDELIEDSNQAFQSSASALRSARARGEAGESLEAAAVRLDRLGGVEPEPEYFDEYESDEPEFDEDEFEDEIDGEVDPDADVIDEEG